METITVYRSTYEDLRKNEFALMQDHAYLKGKIIALADIIKTNPDYVKEALAEMAKEYKGETV